MPVTGIIAWVCAPIVSQSPISRLRQARGGIGNAQAR
jgi:hypothetical protein